MFGFLADYLFTKEEQPTMANFNARFEMLNALKNHWWKRRTPAQNRKVFTDITENIVFATSGYGITISYSVEATISSGGGLSLSSPTSYSKAFSNEATAFDITEELVALAPVYVTGLSGDSSGIYYLPEGSTCQKSSVSAETATITASNTAIRSYASETVSVKLQKVTVKNVAGNWEYIQSPDRSAYPDSGEQGGYEYQYLGVPFENAVGAPKIETGSYIGTGTYGSSNPNTLALSFKPRVVIIHNSTYSFVFGGSYSDGYAFGIVVDSLTSDYTQIRFGRYTRWRIKINANTLYWYNDSSNEAAPQLNVVDTTYYYIALG